jgi:hypothetical protein
MKVYTITKKDLSEQKVYRTFRRLCLDYNLVYWTLVKKPFPQETEDYMIRKEPVISTEYPKMKKLGRDDGNSVS